MRKNKNSLVKIASTVLLVLVWLATFTVAMCWLLDLPLPFKPEPVTAVLVLLSPAITAVVRSYIKLLQSKDKELEAERFSMPDALAHGYVENFIEPAITKLIRETPPGKNTPRLYIYMPEDMSEVEPKSIDRTIARIREQNYSTSVVNLDIEAGRARDILTIFKGEKDSATYFDFPNTLRTLIALVEYKVPSKAESFNKKEKQELGRAYIERFKTRVEKMISEKDLSQYVFFTDKNLNFLRGDKTRE